MTIPLKARSFLGIIQKASQTKLHQSRITKSKVLYVQFPLPKWEKTKKWVKCSGLQNGAMRGLQIRAVFRDYKSGQEGLQIGGRFRDFKLGLKDYKSGQEIQIGAKRDFKGISNRGRDYKLVQNKYHY